MCNGDVIRSEHLPPSLQMIKKTEVVAKRSLNEIVENTERELIVDALLAGLSPESFRELVNQQLKKINEEWNR